MLLGKSFGWFAAVFTASCFCLFSLLVVAQSQSPTPQTVSPNLIGRSLVRKLTGNELVTFPAGVLNAQQQIHFFSVTSRSGKYIPLPAELQVLGRSTSVSIHDIAVTRLGHLLILASTAVGAAALSEPKTNLLLESNEFGATVNKIDLGSFTGEQICTAGDGTWWTLGEDQRKEELMDLNYDLVRRYTPTGNQLNSYVPRSLVGYLTTPLRIGRHAVPAFLACSDQLVGVYLGSNATWTEVSVADGYVRHWTMSRIPSARINGLALTARGRCREFKTQQR